MHPRQKRMRLPFTKAPERYFCAVHGKKTKPLHCQSFSHKPAGESACKRCGACCKLNVGVFVEPELLQGTLGAIREKAGALKDVGVDAEMVVRYVSQTSVMPPRRLIDAKSQKGISHHHCAALIPEKVARKAGLDTG